MLRLFPSWPQDERDDRGATATEYAILVAFIAAVILVGITVFGSQLNTGFTGAAEHLGSFFAH